MKRKKSTKKNDSPSDPDTSSSIEESQPPVSSFPIVGIGASAGGLAALERFFTGLPKDIDPDMAFVLVQHLAPDHKSILADLVGRYTRMQVFEVEDGMAVEPNCAYIIRPGFDMAFLNGALHLFEPTAPRGRRLSIDFFFRSLAQDQGDRAIGIVLSGTGSDGALGVRAIKGDGGMVMVQTPESAEYDGMPRSAIATGLVDYELPPEKMAAALIAYGNHSFKENVSADTVLKKIFILVRSHTGHDFSSYKVTTTRRRVERRMAVLQIDSIDEYLRYLQQSSNERDALFKDMLIGVTNFFRDTEAFKVLEEAIIPKLFAGKSPGGLVRVWSAGCSTGEEAYSIAILLKEYMEAMKQTFTGQVFATDIDPKSIALARAGVYPVSIATDVTPERLSRFFTPERSGPDGEVQSYRINKNIRDMLIFSEQNIIKDPPFSKMDLICSRNLMIYLNSDLQKKLIPLFHYAINPGGYLFLGSSESVGDFTDLFHLVDRKSKLYLRKDHVHSTRHATVSTFFQNTARPAALPTGTGTENHRQGKHSLREVAEQTLVQQLAPASALVNSQGDIFYLHGRTGMYLEPGVGEVGSYNIIRMAREGLRHELTVALRKAVQGNEVVRSPNLSVKTNGTFAPVTITISPAADDETAGAPDKLYLVIIEEGQVIPPSDPKSIGRDTSEADPGLIASLRAELRAKEASLQTAMEEIESSNEDLRSSNEEMQSVNEELQSTNEELETSKEELQSVNEELSTVNNELSTKFADLSRLNNDMNNLLAGTGIATVFVDHQLRILRFTPTISAVINLIQGDVGRPVHHILTNLTGYDSLTADIEAVLDTLIPKEIEVQTVNGRWFMMNILPYRTLDNVIEGAVITFVDIMTKRALQEELQEQLSEKNLLLKEVHHRIKNNIASINGLLSIQLDSSSNPEVVLALQDAIGRINGMQILYEKLLIGDGYESLPVQNYVKSLADSIFVLLSDDLKVTSKVEIDDFSLTPKILFPLGIIINELLTNIMKHAFKGRKSGKIDISLRNSHNRITLTIQDNGNGLPEGFDEENSNGFGLMLINMLSKQLDGTYTIEDHNGTRSILTFDL